MDTERIRKTEAFLKDTFQNSPYLSARPQELAYRLEHSYRVANIGKQIAQAEGFDVTNMVIACLLHDISYCQEMPTRQARMDHGRLSARIAAPFLEELGIPREEAMDILCGIAIHVDDEAGFPCQRTPFAETIGDADNIDRFDAYRIYETLEHSGFRQLPLEEKQKQVETTLTQLSRLRGMKLGTATAANLWQQRLDAYMSFYQRLQLQIETSAAIR